MSYDYDCINNGWLNIAHGDGVFVAVSDFSNKSATSADNGKTWTRHDMPIGDWHSVAYGNDVFVAVNLLYNTSARSTDNGKTWTQHSMLN